MECVAEMCFYLTLFAKSGRILTITVSFISFFFSSFTSCPSRCGNALNGMARHFRKNFGISDGVLRRVFNVSLTLEIRSLSTRLNWNFFLFD